MQKEGTSSSPSQAPTGGPVRRRLRFADLAQVVPEVRRLERGHRTVANWSLAQICVHLAQSLDGSIDGFDMRRHRFKRLVFRRRMLRYALTRGMPRDFTVDPKLTPPPGKDQSDAARQLERAIQRYEQRKAALMPHPLFGLMPRDVWDRIHCIHCAHHLSFAIPEGP